MYLNLLGGSFHMNFKDNTMYLKGVMPNDTAKELLLGIEVALNALSFFR